MDSGTVMDDNLTCCSKCHKPRYHSVVSKATKPKPIATKSYLPIAKQLATYVAHKHNREKLRHGVDVDSQKEVYKDIFDGAAIKGLKDWNEENIALSVYVDGFQPFIYSTVSMTIVLVIILSLPPTER